MKTICHVHYLSNSNFGHSSRCVIVEQEEAGVPCKEHRGTARMPLLIALKIVFKRRLMGIVTKRCFSFYLPPHPKLIGLFRDEIMII